MNRSDTERILNEGGVRPTAMRLLVYEELSRTGRPLSLREMEERMPTAERSTIFRTLTLLLQHHLVHAIEDGSGALRYETCEGEGECTPDDQHIHFYCERCQRTFCLRQTPVPAVTLPDGFRPTTYNYMIHGLCPECR